MKKIAILEDDKDYREVLIETLKNEGFDVYGAPTGHEIVEKMVKEKPDLILLDLVLPKILGVDVISVFQKKDVIAGVPIIVMSSKDEAEIKEAAEKVNAAGWLKKPVEKNDLLEMIKTHVG
jgi:DNA-binding response OmpR family regulator